MSKSRLRQIISVISILAVGGIFADSIVVARAQVTDEGMRLYMLENKRQNLVDWHRKLIDRYNNLLNKIAFLNNVNTKEGRNVELSKSIRDKLKKSREVLARSSLLGTLKNRQRDPDKLDAITEEFHAVDRKLLLAEEEWAKKTSVPITEITQSTECARKAVEAGAPMTLNELRTAVDGPLAICLNAQKISMDGKILTYDGLRSIDQPPIPVKIQMKDPEPEARLAAPMVASNSENKKTGDGKGKPGGAGSAASPPAPLPDPTAAKPTDAEEARIATMPSVGDAPLIDPPSKQAVLAQAADVVKRFDKVKHTFDDIGIDFGEFQLASEAHEQKDPLLAKYRYSVARHKWKKSAEKYKALDRSIPEAESMRRLQQVLEHSRKDFWKPYTAVNAQMTDVMLGEGGNCNTQSGFIASLQQAMAIKLPPGKRLLVQYFTGHVQPVIYDEKDGSVLDIVNSKLHKGTPVPLYDPTILVNLWLATQKSPVVRPNTDFLVAQANVKPDPATITKNSAAQASDNFKTNAARTDGPDPGVRWADATAGGNPAHDTMVKVDILHPSKEKEDGEPQTDVRDNARYAAFSAEMDKRLEYGRGVMKTVQRNGKSVTVTIKQIDIDKKSKDTPKLSASELLFEFEDYYDAKDTETISDYDKLRQHYFKSHLASTIGDFGSREPKIKDLNEKIDLAIDLTKNVFTNSGKASKLIDEKMPYYRFWASDAVKFAYKAIDTYPKPLTSAEKEALLSKTIPRYKELQAELEALKKRVTENRDAYAKLFNEAGDEDFSKNWAVLNSLLNAINWNNDPKKRIEVHTDAARTLFNKEKIAWTKVDLKKKKPIPDKPAAPKTLPPSPSPSPSPISTLKTDSAWQDPRAIKALREKRPSPTPTPSESAVPLDRQNYVLKKSMLLEHPERIYNLIDILSHDSGKPLTQEEKNSIRELWTPAYTDALHKSLVTKAYKKTATVGFSPGETALENLENSVRNQRYHNISRAFPEENRCEVYGYVDYSPDKSYSCMPREVARLQYLLIKALVDRGGKKFNGDSTEMRIGAGPGGDTFNKTLTNREMLELMRLQIEGDPLPAWFVQARDEARKNGAYKGDYPADPAPKSP